MGYHKSLALDPSCLLTPPNTPQGMELAELEADLQEGTRQLKKGKSVLAVRKEISVRISSKYKPKQSSKYLFIYSFNPEHPEHQALTNIHLPYVWYEVSVIKVIQSFFLLQRCFKNTTTSVWDTRA